MPAHKHQCSVPFTFKRRMVIFFASILTMTIALFSISTGSAFASSSGFGIGGYDPVSFFDTTGPVFGSEDLVIEYDGAKYIFHNKNNADKFRANPDRYAPQFGGNCAFGMVFGSKSTVDPKVWKIIDGRLYFHINAGTQRTWSKKYGSYIKRAEVAWKSVK